MAIFGVEERGLDKRVADYSTQVSMAKTRISYGNIKPADVLQHLSSVCTDALTGCNYEDTDPLTIPSEMYVNKVTIPVSGHLTLNPKGLFAQGNGSQFVDCVVKTAPYGTQVSPFEVVCPIFCGSADHCPNSSNLGRVSTHVSHPRLGFKLERLTLTPPTWIVRDKIMESNQSEPKESFA